MCPCKRPQKWQNQNLIIHHDNAPAHRSFKVLQFLAKNNMTVIPHTHPIWPLWLFPLPQAEASDEGSKIRHHWRDSRGIAAVTWHSSKKGLPGLLPRMAEKLGPLYLCKRWVLWRWWRNLTSKLSKLLFISTVLELLDTSLYYLNVFLSFVWPIADLAAQYVYCIFYCMLAEPTSLQSSKQLLSTKWTITTSKNNYFNRILQSLCLGTFYFVSGFNRCGMPTAHSAYW